MNWLKLLSLNKYKDKRDRLRADQDELRLGFEVDYDRIVFSSHFRKLQDKTQVIPLSPTGFVHTRLTHSLEVSVVARSLGRAVGKVIVERDEQLQKAGYRAADFGAITAAAALAHDIGNPPFGHSGEKAIGAFFSQTADRWQLSRKRLKDLTSFEGNANGYRLLNLSTPSSPGGLRLTHATLGAFVKYPKESLPVKPSDHIGHKKFNIFQSDVEHFRQLAASLELARLDSETFARHPLTYLVEAADDICYTIIDFEDGINLGWIPEDYALEYLSAIVRNHIDSSKYSLMTSQSERLSYLRSMAINALITDAVDVFLENEQNILKGDFPKSLMDSSRYRAQCEDILSLTFKRVYRHEQVIQKEVAGYNVLQTILKSLTDCVYNIHHGELSHYDSLILQACNLGKLDAEDGIYENLMSVSSYVASLSDHQAVQLSEMISGHHRLP